MRVPIIWRFSWLKICFKHHRTRKVLLLCSISVQRGKQNNCFSKLCFIIGQWQFVSRHLQVLHGTFVYCQLYRKTKMIIIRGREWPIFKKLLEDEIVFSKTGFEPRLARWQSSVQPPHLIKSKSTQMELIRGKHFCVGMKLGNIFWLRGGAFEREGESCKSFILLIPSPPPLKKETLSSLPLVLDSCILCHTYSKMFWTI